MKVYLVSLAIGFGVGVIYGLIGVRSPAPPIVALMGLLGMLVGEQVVPWVMHRVVDWRSMTHVSDHTPKVARAGSPAAGGKSAGAP